ncbi:MAG: hypothetical protein R2799_02935 [Crocinitomicaceae bacterium]
MKKLVFAELVEGVSFQMMEDRNVVIVSDGAFFLVTTEEHSKEYPELKFDHVPSEAIEQYGLENLL